MNEERHRPARPDSNDAPFVWAKGSGAGAELASETRAWVRRRHRRRLVAASTLCVLVLVGTFAWRSRPDDAARVASTNSFRVAGPERRVLPDGSRIELNGDAAVATEFSPTLRRVVLVRGEAHFDVAKDAARPFVVVAAGAEVRAVGTAFSVARDDGAVEVVVTEGRVAVTRTAAAPAPIVAAVAEIAVEAGNCVVVKATELAAPPLVRAVSPDEVSRRLAWRVPRLTFEGAPLPDALRLFAEHGGARMTLADPSLRGVKVSGVLRADNAAALLQLLADDHAIEAEQLGDSFVLRRRR